MNSICYLKTSANRFQERCSVVRREKNLRSRFLMITYTGGTTSKDKIVPIIRPPNTTVPMDCWELAPTLWAITKGKKQRATPRMSSRSVEVVHALPLQRPGQSRNDPGTSLLLWSVLPGGDGRSGTRIEIVAGLFHQTGIVVWTRMGREVVVWLSHCNRSCPYTSLTTEQPAQTEHLDWFQK